MTTANESKLGGARGGHRGPIVLRVAAARVLPLLPVAARGARLVLSMGLAARLCPRAQQLIAPPRGSLSAVGGIDKPSRSLAALPRACGVWEPLVQAGCRVPANLAFG